MSSCHLLLVILLVILLFIGLRVASGDSAVVLHTNVTGKDGETKLLPCSTEGKNISDDIIQWYKGPKTKENKPIHTYSQRVDPPQIPREDFIDLTSIPEEGLLSGNCSLNLRVNSSLNGTYYCHVKGKLCCTVNLKVLPKGKNNTSGKRLDESQDKPNNGTDGLTTAKIGGIAAAAALVPICIIALVVYLYPKRSKRSKRRKRRNEPADQNPNEEQIPMKGGVVQGK